MRRVSILVGVVAIWLALGWYFGTGAQQSIYLPYGATGATGAAGAGGATGSTGSTGATGGASPFFGRPNNAGNAGTHAATTTNTCATGQTAGCLFWIVAKPGNGGNSASPGASDFTMTSAVTVFYFTATVVLSSGTTNGNIQVDVMQNDAPSGIVVTIPSGSSSGTTVIDSTHTANYNIGDTINVATHLTTGTSTTFRLILTLGWPIPGGLPLVTSANGNFIEGLGFGNFSGNNADSGFNSTNVVNTTSGVTNFILSPTGFASRIGSPTEGTCQWFNDANSGTFLATISAGSSTNHVLGCFDGTNWTVH